MQSFSSLLTTRRFIVSILQIQQSYTFVPWLFKNNPCSVIMHQMITEGTDRVVVLRKEDSLVGCRPRKVNILSFYLYFGLKSLWQRLL